MRKATSKKRSTTRKAPKSNLQIALQKANDVKKAMRAQLKTLKAEFKDKIQAITEYAYEKAHSDLTRNHDKKLKAKQAAMAAAEARFEKQYAAKANKKARRKTRKAPTVIVATKPKTAATTKRRTKRVARRSVR